MPFRKVIHARKLRRAARTRARVQGTAARPRLSVHRTNRAFYAQLIDDDARKTLASVSLKDIAKKDAKQSKSDIAKSLGRVMAEKAKTKHVDTVVFDRGRYSYHGRIRAFAEAAREAGLIF
jgi:large subunit ribosomal protein L18